jgi:hypothetical protein
MKLPFTIHDSRFTICEKSSGSAMAVRNAGTAVNRQSPIVNRKSERGIALIITLILLSVTLVMAIAFLAISNRERGSVTTSTDAVTAKLAAEAALANAQAQIIASIYATTNPFSAGLVVSTNFQNAYGFVPNISDPTNVNYDYLSGGGALSAVDFEQNVANLLYLPRAPVFVVTNQQTGQSEFRYYLDLNRNGQFEGNGPQPVIGLSGGYLHPNGSENNNPVNAVTNFQTGDPEWIGVLERPDVPHGPNNKFVSRYAFVAMPADGSLDLNAIHNQSFSAALSPANDGFFRNQGVGTWEINLAAFLTDLNTNEWDTLAAPYNYRQPAFANNGFAFQDALSLLSYRYNFDYNSLTRPSEYFPNNAAALSYGPVDIYPSGNPMTSTLVPNYNFNGILNSVRWPGSDNTNHYFAAPSDVFDTSKTARGVVGTNFTQRLEMAGNNISTYDRYTFYRMLAQLGTDTSPEQNKINLNYANAVAYFDNRGFLTNTEVFPNAETNLSPWIPIQFFTIAADRMLREYTASWFRASPSNYLATFYNIHTNYYYTDGFGNVHVDDPDGLGLTGLLGVQNVLGLASDGVPSFGVTNIPVLANGRFVYSPAVQRVLQMAANIYDATTNRASLYGKDYPSVFRPVFEHDGFGNLYIMGFTAVGNINGPGMVSGANDIQLALPYEATNLLSAFPAYQPIRPGGYSVNVYGVPWVIGAKKGFPNFNEFSMESVVQVTRKLQVTRTSPTGVIVPGTRPTLTGTNQMYIFSITNYLGVEFWNSYTNAYTNAQIVVRDNLSVALTNELNYSTAGNYTLLANFNVGRWPGWTNGQTSSFILPFGVTGTNLNILESSAYRFSPQGFVNTGLLPDYENYSITRLPQFGLQLTNRLQLFVLDNGHVIDYASFNGPEQHRNLNTELADPDSTGIPAYLWSTNLFGTTPWGVLNQLNISRGNPKNAIPPDDGGSWSYPPGLPPGLRSGGVLAVQAYFDAFFKPNSTYTYANSNYVNQEFVVQAPYTPTRTMVDYVTWQANDPLVHYLSSDMYYSGAEPSSKLVTGLSRWTKPPDILSDMGYLNQTYQPWGKLHYYANSDTNAYNLAVKDPLVWNSDAWNFPSAKLPTAGWIGRVHRGTPWQTVYLKASNVLKGNQGLGTWANWTGAGDGFTATNTAPLQDRRLFDIFTTALNENATRGQLSVNQGGRGPSLAAWSAVFSGMPVLTNTAANPNTSTNLMYQSITINPAGVGGTNSALGRLVAGINNMRSKFVNADGVVGTFERVGDILSTPQFSEQSPFLNWNNAAQQQYGISDQMYEWLPQQAMSLLRVDDAPRYVVYSYGQTLKPAANGVVTGGPNLANGASPFGMVTNYQIVAESATRAVLQVNRVVSRNSDGTYRTNYNTKIEQFNVLPPD